MTQKYYTDGSLISTTGRARSAAIVTHSNSTRIKKNVEINNRASFLKTVLFAIFIALKLARTTTTDRLIFSEFIFIYVACPKHPETRL